ncbi:MAG: lipoyl synthase [Clostridiales bacterium]|nr:lipoyl synthase [Clostridiales bacterium]
MSNLRKPSWLCVQSADPAKLKIMNDLLLTQSLNTVCKEANCPNSLECYAKKTATFMILGTICSRNCKFCNVTHGITQKVDKDEPVKVADAIVKLGLRHAVITSVTRDDLEDGGAEQFVNVIKEIKKKELDITIEVLIPDFQGNKEALKKVVVAKPHIINHNIETIERLYDSVRSQAKYKQSLELLRSVKQINSLVMTKSGIMVGLGETYDEVITVLKDLRSYDCDFITIGQYLQPSKDHYEVREYIHPDVFDRYKKEALNIGFKYVASAPLVRSSYNASDFYEAFKER